MPRNGIAWTSSDDESARRNSLTLSDVPGHPRGGGSTWQSLMKGAPTLETDYFNGEIIMLGRLHGVPTPTNEFLQQFAARLLRGEVQAGSVTTDQLDAEWESWSTVV